MKYQKLGILGLLLLCVVSLAGCASRMFDQSGSPAGDLENLNAQSAITQQESPCIANPNCFAPASDGRLLLADLANGFSILDTESCESIPCVDTTTRLPAAICEYENEYYIADYRNNRVVVLNKDGHMLREWTHAQMSDPEGITVDEDGNIYVASYGNGYILKFTTGGELLLSWNTASTSSDPLVHPHGLFYYENRIYITELQPPARVIVYDTNGTFQRQFGNDASTDYALEYPTTLYVHNDTIYVSDAVACQIKLFSLEGDFLDSFGSFGMDGGQFFYPYGIGVDADGNIYVGDTHNRRVQVFDSNWDLIKIYSEHAIDIGSPQAKSESPAISVSEEAVLDLDGDSITVHNGTLYYTNLKKGTLSAYADGQASLLSSGYSYPWQVNATSDGIVIVDEPGSINLMLDDGSGSIYYPLTSLQFNAPEISNTFIYRFQDAAFGEDIICLANTLPGIILLLDPYGSYVATVTPASSDKLGIPRITGVAMNGRDLFYTNMKGSVGCINIDTQESFELQSPIGVYQPYGIAVAKNIVAVTEPYANRIQLWNCETLEWIGYVDHSVAASLDMPWDITFSDTTMLVSSAGNDKIIALDLTSLSEDTGGSSSHPAASSICTFDTLATEVKNVDSLFMDIYHGRLENALNYWESYRDENGIVQYDFSFSFLSDNLPVPAGYGRQVWPNGVAQYALLNHYRNTEDALIQEELHADWLVQNAQQNAQGIYYWPNSYDTMNPELQPDFMAASTQTLGAAALIKAAEHFPDKAAQYLQIARSALSAFELSIEAGGVRTMINDHVFFADYANATGYISYDVIPMAWVTAALYETGEMGRSYYQEACDTWNNELASKTMLGDSLFCGSSFISAETLHVWSSNLAHTVLSFINKSS